MAPLLFTWIKWQSICNPTVPLYMVVWDFVSLLFFSPRKLDTVVLLYCCFPPHLPMCSPFSLWYKRNSEQISLLPEVSKRLSLNDIRLKDMSKMWDLVCFIYIWVLKKKKKSAISPFPLLYLFLTFLFFLFSSLSMNN